MALGGCYGRDERMTRKDNTLELLSDLVKKAKRTGADAADAVDINSVALSHAQRLGNVEKAERS